MLGALLTAVTLITASQSVVSTITPATPVQSVQTASANSQLVTVSFKNARLPDAIKEISRQANVPVMYSEVVVPAGHLVTYTANSVSAGDALRAVLKNTGVVVQSAGIGGYRLARGGATKLGQGVISGRVTDAKGGKGVLGASVSVGTDTRGVITDENGSYRLTGIPVGTHAITVRLVGYAKQTRSVTIRHQFAMST